MTSESCPADTDLSSQPRQLELPDEDIEAVGCFLEFLYTGEYFPKKVPGSRTLESDPSLPKVDETGVQLLKHARVYTLADKFGVPSLRTLASSKIHCVNSTAKGEIAYAEYVYAYTSEADTTIRAPIANFWASRSHTLRAEAEPEFKALCLQYPQFGYDVLSEWPHGDMEKEILGALCAILLTCSQPVSSTRSSSARPTPGCTQALPAPASALATAMSRRTHANTSLRIVDGCFSKFCKRAADTRPWPWPCFFEYMGKIKGETKCLVELARSLEKLSQISSDLWIVTVSRRCTIW